MVSAASLKPKNKSHKGNRARGQCPIGHRTVPARRVGQILSHPERQKHRNNGCLPADREEQLTAAATRIQTYHLVRRQVAFIEGQRQIRHLIKSPWNNLSKSLNHTGGRGPAEALFNPEKPWSLRRSDRSVCGIECSYMRLHRLGAPCSSWPWQSERDPAHPRVRSTGFSCAVRASSGRTRPAFHSGDTSACGCEALSVRRKNRAL